VAVHVSNQSTRACHVCNNTLQSHPRGLFEQFAQVRGGCISRFPNHKVMLSQPKTSGNQVDCFFYQTLTVAMMLQNGDTQLYMASESKVQTPATRCCF
jgi:hypothetical protein